MWPNNYPKPDKNLSSEVTSHKKSHLATLALVGLGLTCIIILLGLIRRTGKVSLSNGAIVSTIPASFWATWLSQASCKVVYQPSDRQSGTVVFLQNTDSRVAMVMPASDGKSLFCLYCADVLFRLVKIDPTQEPEPLPKDSYLHYIVLASSYHIEAGTSNDWREVCEYLKTVPTNTFNEEAATTYDLGIVRLHFERKDLLPAVEQQIENMRWGFTY
jgi:hypothetical protein